MDDLRAMKGSAALVAAILQDGHTYCLHRFLDGSLEINRDDRPLGVWEHEEVANCLAIFFQTLARAPALRVAILLNTNQTPLANGLFCKWSARWTFSATRLEFDMSLTEPVNDNSHGAIAVTPAPPCVKRQVRLLVVDDHLDTVPRHGEVVQCRRLRRTDRC